MESLYLLIPLALIFVALALWLFFWSVGSGQFDDLEKEANRILFEEDDAAKTDVAGDEHTESPPESQSDGKENPRNDRDA